MGLCVVMSGYAKQKFKSLKNPAMIPDSDGNYTQDRLGFISNVLFYCSSYR